MRSTPFLLVLALGTAILTGCGDDDPVIEADVLALSDLVGSWTATTMVFTNVADGSQSFDLIAAGGEHRITVLPDGRARHWVELGTFVDEWDAAYSLSGNTLTATPAESSRPVLVSTISLDGSVATLETTGAVFDFTLTGATPVPATVNVVLVRQ